MKEYKILKYIYENLNASQRQMSEKLNISIGSINNLIKNMSKEGLINIQVKDSKYN